LGKAERERSVAFGSYCCLELGSAQRHTEDRTARFENTAGAKAVQPDGVVADALDDFRNGIYRTCVVASHAERPAVR